MNAHERRSRVNISHHQGNGFFRLIVPIATGLGAKAINAECSPTRGEAGGSDLLDPRRSHIFIIVVKYGCNTLTGESSSRSAGKNASGAFGVTIPVHSTNASG